MFGEAATLLHSSPHPHSWGCPLSSTHHGSHCSSEIASSQLLLQQCRLPPYSCTPVCLPLQLHSLEEIYCSPRLLWANTNKMLFCCNLFNWPQKRRLEPVQLCPRLPSQITHVFSSLRPVPARAWEGGLVKSKRGQRVAAGLQRAGVSLPSWFLWRHFTEPFTYESWDPGISQTACVQILPLPLLNCMV